MVNRTPIDAWQTPNLERLVQAAALARECRQERPVLACPEADRVDANATAHRLARVTNHRIRAATDVAEAVGEQHDALRIHEECRAQRRRECGAARRTDA